MKNLLTTVVLLLVAVVTQASQLLPASGDGVFAPVTEPLSIHRNGDNSPSANIPWGGFGITGLSFFEVGTTNPGKYRLTSAIGGSVGEGAIVQGQTSGLGMGWSIYSKDSDGTQAVGTFIFAKGQPDLSGQNEFMQFGWDPTQTAFVVKTSQFSGGLNRPLSMQAGGGGAVRVTLNTTAAVGVQVQGNLAITQAGRGLQVKTGTNQMAGTATLTAGTVTVTNANVTNNTVCLVTVKTLGTVATPQAMRCVAGAGTNVVITSESAVDTSVVQYMLLEAN